MQPGDDPFPAQSRSRSFGEEASAAHPACGQKGWRTYPRVSAMRCKEFDAHVDEMLSGVLHSDADQHMRQCERCTSYYRAQTLLHNGLRAVAAAPTGGPSRATDRAVMESYRRLQERRGGAGAQPADSGGGP